MYTTKYTEYYEDNKTVKLAIIYNAVLKCYAIKSYNRDGSRKSIIMKNQDFLDFTHETQDIISKL